MDDQIPRSGNPDFPLSEDAFESNAELLENVTESGPPELRITLTNTTNEEIMIQGGVTFPFTTSELLADNGAGTLFLYHPSMGSITAPKEPIDGCWQVEDADRARKIRAGLGGATLGAEDAVSESYTLYNHPDNSPCFPDGEYSATSGGHLHLDEGVWMELELRVTIEDNRVERVGTDGPVIPL